MEDFSTDFIVSTTEPYDINEFQIVESSNQNCDGHSSLYGDCPSQAQMELEYFPEMEEIECDSESSQEHGSSQADKFLVDEIKTITVNSIDISEIKNKLNSISVKSEIIAEKLKIQDVQYKAIERKIDCFNLVLEMKLKDLELTDLEYIQIGEGKQFTDEEINKFLSS